MSINIKDKLVTLESLGVVYNAEVADREAADEALGARIDNIVAPEGDPSLSEVSDARTGADNTVHATLKDRLDSEYEALDNKIDNVTITTDSTLDTTSTNPIQNAPVAEAIEQINASLNALDTELSGDISDLNNQVNQKDGIIDNVNIKADDKLSAVLFDGNLKEAYVAYKRGGINLLTGEYNADQSVLQCQMVDWMFGYIPLESDDVTISVKNGYQVRGVLFNPDKTYNTWFNWSTGGTISALNNKKGYFVRFVISRVDGTVLTDEEVASAGIDTVSVSANLGLSGGLIAKVLDADFGKFYGKKVVNFGDSIFGNFRDTNETTDKSISRMIAEATGATVYNCGFGGCRMAYHSEHWRAFSMYALADAIATNSWTDQDAAIAAGLSGMPSYFSETLALLKSINFNAVDYITIGYGTNDYSGNIFLNYMSSLTEVQYFTGALEYSIKTILTAFPHIRIAVISPCWRWFLADGEYSYSSDDASSVNSRGFYLYDYVDACKTICEKLHVAYIDTYYTLGFNEYTHLQYFPSNDGTHPNQNGRQLRADRIIGQMNALF